MPEPAGAPPFLPPRLAAMLWDHLIDSNAHTGCARLERCAPSEQVPGLRQCVAALGDSRLDDYARRRRKLASGSHAHTVVERKVSRQLLRWNTQHGKRH